jgi:hypothetical protein
MGGCLSKQKSTAKELEVVQPTPTTNRETILPHQPSDNGHIPNNKTRSAFTAKDDADVELESVPTTTLKLGGLKIRYASMSKRGYYPEGPLALVETILPVVKLLIEANSNSICFVLYLIDQ